MRLSKLLFFFPLILSSCGLLLHMIPNKADNLSSLAIVKCTLDGPNFKNAWGDIYLINIKTGRKVINDCHSASSGFSFFANIPKGFYRLSSVVGVGGKWYVDFNENPLVYDFEVSKPGVTYLGEYRMRFVYDMNREPKITNVEKSDPETENDNINILKNELHTKYPNTGWTID